MKRAHTAMRVSAVEVHELLGLLTGPGRLSVIWIQYNQFYRTIRCSMTREITEDSR